MASEVGQLLQQWLEDARGVALQHALLARAELRAWLQRVGPHAAVALLLLPGVGAGLLLLGVAAALALGRCLPLPAAFALTGLALATPGALAAWTLARAVRRAPAPLAATRAEVEGTLQALRPAGGGA